MYRDDASVLDEHDRAVGAILIAETLLAQCQRAAELVRAPHAPERWRAMRQLQDDHDEIYRQLDRARDVLAARGANTLAYEDLRADLRPSLAIARDDDTQVIDADAFEDVRRAIEALKLAVPGADWRGIARRTRALVELPTLRRRHRLATAGLVTAFVTGAATWFLATIPERRPDPRVEMRRELSEIAIQRKVTLVHLQFATHDRCDRALARDYARLLVMDGRGADAERFGADYADRCGADTVVANWANAPRAPR